MTDPLVLMTVHAHPDDESSKGAGTVARYVASGVQAVLVCCTGGEEGDILNPAMDRDDVRADLPNIRRQELDSAAKVIGYDVIEMLGYRDSGMAGSESNAHPECFARADAQEAVGRLVQQIRKYRPQVMITYADDQELYPHPDHLRVHDISIAAFDAAADVASYPELGDAWQISKLYYSVFPLEKLQRLQEELIRRGEPAIFPPELMEMPLNDEIITTRVDLSEWSEVSRDALREHATQIDPTSALWFGIMPELEKELGNTDDYILARSLVESDESAGDLFSGVRGNR